MGCGASTPAPSTKYEAAEGASNDVGKSSANLKRASSMVSRPTSTAPHAAFVSHCKADAAMEARFLQTELEGKLDKKVFLDSDDLRDLTELMNHVKDSKALILLQSKSVLERPYCLLELVAAIDHGVPIIGVALQGQNGYEFAGAARFLQHLDTYLEQANPGAAAVLRDNGVEPIDVAWKLSQSLPKIISVPLNTSASRNLLNATIDDIQEAMSRAKPQAITGDKELWQKSRGEAPPLFGDLSETSLSNSMSSHMQESRTPSERSGVSAASRSIAGGAPSYVSGGEGDARTKIAVAYSSDTDPENAVASAYRQMVKKLGRDCTPSVIIVNFSFMHDAAKIGAKLRSLCPPNTPFIGGGSNGGCVVEGQWLSKDGYFLGIQAIYDPDGVYALFHSTHESGGLGFVPLNGLVTPNFQKLPADEFKAFYDKVGKEIYDKSKASVDAIIGPARVAAEANGLGDTPQLCIALSSMSHVEPAVEGVIAAVGSRIPMTGGNAQAMGHAGPEVQHLIISNSQADGVITAGNQALGGMAGFLCWPAVHVAGAFCSGLTPERSEGVITACTGQTVFKIDDQPAWQFIRQWYPNFTDEMETAAIKSAAEGPMKDLLGMLGNCGKAFSMMDVMEHMKDQEGSKPPIMNPIGAYLGSADGEDVHRVVMPMFIDKTDDSVTMLVKVDEGDKLCSMYGKRLDVRDRTARVAKQVVKNAGFDVDTVIGGFSFMCGMNYMMTGDTGMQTLAEKLGDALGWTPTLGIIGGPEFGTMATGGCSVGAYMYSTVVFSSVPVGVPFGTGTFASGATSMQVSKTGTVLHAVSEEKD